MDRWTFEITGLIDEPRSWTWDEFNALPSETVTLDIHCVTKWSKLDTTWTGASVDTLLEGVETEATHIMASSYGGYTTNLPLADVVVAVPGSPPATTMSPSTPSMVGSRASSRAPSLFLERHPAIG